MPVQEYGTSLGKLITMRHFIHCVFDDPGPNVLDGRVLSSPTTAVAHHCSGALFTASYLSSLARPLVRRCRKCSR